MSERVAIHVHRQNASTTTPLGADCGQYSNFLGRRYPQIRVDVQHHDGWECKYSDVVKKIKNARHASMCGDGDQQRHGSSIGRASGDIGVE